MPAWLRFDPPQPPTFEIADAAEPQPEREAE